MDALVKTNLENTDGYGSDHHCDEAKALIRRLTGSSNMHVHFLMGGTQTNLAAIASFLRPHQAVISADTGHICVHEVGAVEATGHKVIHIPTDDGKLRPEHIEETLEIHEDFHWVQPKLIYISNLTETGIFYTKKELTNLRKTCDKHGLYIYMRGVPTHVQWRTERPRGRRLRRRVRGGRSPYGCKGGRGACTRGERAYT